MKKIIKYDHLVYLILMICLALLLTSYLSSGRNPLVIIKETASRFLVAQVGGASPPPAQPATWQPPAGVVEPPFGINERHTMYVDQNFAAGGFPYRDAGNGPYTHYVDNSVACNDSNAGGYGTQAEPRCTIPAAAAPGAVIEVHGTSYTLSGNHTWYFPGSDAAPVFLRGVGFPVLQGNAGRFIFQGSYFIMEGFLVDNMGIWMGSLSNFSFRNNELRNMFATAIVVEASNVVFYNNHIHHNGDSENPDEADYHAFKILHNISNAWILNNHIHHNGGDSIQVGDAGSAEPWAHHIYIAGNVMHDDRENAVDIKRARDVVVSGNVAYSYQSVSSASGEIIVIHDGAERIWILNNFLCCSHNGVVSTEANDLGIMGNVITNINGPDDPGSLYAPAAIHVRATFNSYIAHNTIWNVENGISSISFNTATYILNNIVGSVFGPEGHHIALGNTSAMNLSTVETNNLVGSSRLLRVGGSVFNTLETFKTTYNKCLYCHNTDPLFVNAAGNNFALTAGSPMIDVGIDQSFIMNAFAAAYGVGMDLDLARAPRPVGEGWDIGAYEYWTGGSGGSGGPDEEPDTTPPVISGVLASPIQERSASITWTTNESADSQIEYGTTNTYGSTTVLSNFSLARTLNLTNLTPGTLYYYRVKSRDGSGNLGTSGDHTFTTLGQAPIGQSTTTPEGGGGSGDVGDGGSDPVPPPVDYSTPAPSDVVPAPRPTDPSIPIVNANLNISRTLSFGSTGSDVIALQNYLISIGYLPIGYNTGYYGTITRAAVQKYQCSKNITCTGDEFTTGYGLVGERTRAALRGGSSMNPVPTQPSLPGATGQLSLTRNLFFGSTGTDVIALQNYLIAKNYLGAGYNTGYYGNLTKAAVEKFQCANNIVCEGDAGTTGYGTVGPRTRSKIAQ